MLELFTGKSLGTGVGADVPDENGPWLLPVMSVAAARAKSARMTGVAVVIRW